MTDNIEFDAVSNSWDDHSTVDEHPIAGVQIAQATSGQVASEPVPVDVGKGAPAQGADNAQGANAQGANAQGANQPAAAANAPAPNAPAGNAAANAAASNVPHEYHAEAGNVVKLPANVSIDNIKVDGHNLVLVQPDGSEIVIKDGALNVPTFVIGDVEVPRVALIAALESSHINVAYGADGSISAGGNGSPSSAGGNFEHPAGGIGDGFGLTSLLPPTDLAFGQLDHRELFPSLLKADSTPSIGVIAEASVDEAGLPARNGEPAGSDSASNSETTSGTISFTSPDGVSQVTLGGHVLGTVPQTFTDATGSLTASYSFNAATGTGTINYTYTLLDNTSGDNTNVSFGVGVTDADGDAAPPGTLVINIIDDAPTAVADTDAVPSGSHAEIDGNVITGAGSDGNAGGADVRGADDVTVVGVAVGDTGASLDNTSTVGTVIQGTYGKLTLNADGSYSYVRDAGTQGGHDDVFTYTIKDGDGDLSHTTLTISIGDSTPTDSIPAPGLASTTVYEAGLPPHGGLPAGSGEIADGNPNNNSNTSETTSGTIGFTSPDGISVVSLGGHVLSDVPQTFTDATGSMTASYVYDANTGVGTISYAYTLTTNTSGDNTSTSFAVVVTDADGDSAPAGNLVINIVDDVPTAHADTDSVAANQFSAETGNVLTAVGTTSPVSGVDVLGADGATVAGVAAGNTNANLDSAATVGTVIQGTYGKLTLNADGSYSYVRDAGTQGGHDDVFTYTIKDGDGDLSHTTLTISIGDSTPTDSIPAPGLASTTVYEAGLPPHGGLPAGSGEIADGNPNNNSNTSETTSGTIGFTSPDGISVVSLGGHVLSGVPQTFTDATGSMTASYVYDANTGVGTISYAYTLTTNTSGDNTSTSFAVVVTDADGDSAPAGNLVINIVDDVPTAHADTDSVAANQFSAETGNVLTAVGTTSPVSGVDVLGADGATVAGVAAGNTNANLDSAATVGTVIQGTYGKLTLNADGSYSYVRDAGTQGGHDDVFTYTIKDGDGDLSHTTLTISIGDSTPTDSIPAPGLASTTVYEAGLPPHGGLPAGSGEIADGNPNNNSNTSETTSGTIGFTSPDGISVVSLGGHVLSGVPQTFTDATGSMTASYVYDANTGVGTISYAYTLTTNTSGDNTSTSFAVVVTDADGDSAPAGNLVINIVDDVPTAHADTDSVAANQFSAETGNVLTAVGTTSPVSGVDVLGADGATVAGVAAGNTNANLDSAATVGTVIQGTYGKLTLNADGSYSYVRDAGTQGGHDDVFTYTIKDGDGDLSHTTLTISIGDSTPTDSIPAPGLASTTVYEAGLPPHGGLPAGSGEIADGNPNNNSNTSETTSGTIGFTSPDGISVVSLGGHVLSGVPQTFTDATGSMTASYVYDANTGVGTISYAYTLTTNTSGDNTSTSFAVVVTDADGDSAPAGNLVINIVDDVPTAHADTDSAAANQFSAETGNVLTAVGTTSPVSGVDVLGADGATVAGVAAGNTNANLDSAATVGTVIQGTYGKLTLNADGSYSYVRDAGTQGGHDDVFTYTIKDGDGDLSHTTLTISIGDSTPTDSIPAPGLASTTVYEAGLPPHGGLPAGSGEIADGNPNNNSNTSETTSGTIGFTSPDGISVVSLGGHVLSGVPQTFTDATGSMTASYVYDANTGVGTISYAYTLTTNTSGDNTSTSFAVVVTDADGDSAPAGNLIINIVDDVPTAHNDTNSAQSGQTVTGNVETNDTAGADGIASIAWTGASGNTVTGSFGTLTIGPDGSYSYHANPNASGTEVFAYTITDGDGDTSPATLTITVSNGQPQPVAATQTVNEAALDTVTDPGDVGHGTVTGSNPSSTAETVSGTLTLGDPDSPHVTNIQGATSSAVGASAVTVQGTYGVLQIDQNGNYTYTLTKPFDTTPDANNGTNTETGKDVFTYTVTDAYGNTSTSTISINIIDDVPTAHADTGNVTEGALLQVTAANGVLSNDVSGADGYAATGAVVGVRAANGDTTTAVTTGVNTQITGQYGTLTLHADGSYTYQATANAISANATDMFVYTIKDGDGDLSTTTLAINVANVTLAADNQTGKVYEASLDLNKDGADLAAGTVTGSAPSNTTETVTGQLAVAGTGITYTPISQTTSHGVFELQANGAWTYTLTSPFDSGATQGANTLTGAESFTYTAKDANGNTVTGTVKIDVVDDVPTLGTVQSQQASNDPSQAPAVGTLHFVAGADGAGATMTITANTTGLTSAGHNLVTEQVGNVLTAYADNNNSGTHDAGDTAVFTITVNPNAGTSGQYTFDLLAPLDGTVTNVSIGKGSSFGNGPTQSIVVQDGNHTVNYVMVTGWAPASGFNEADWLATGHNQPLTQTSNVNGSTAGWGLGNNNFDGGEFMRFDFGTPNDYDGNGSYTPPNISLANVSYATFTFDAVSGSNKIEFVAHYTDGSFHAFTPANGVTSLTITSPSGAQIAWIDAYESSGSTKLNLTDIGVTTTTVDHTIPVTLQLTDGDGDTTTTANFTVHVADGLTPFNVAAPVVLDLNHDGIHTTDLTHSTVSFDYNGDGVASKTAWVDSHDGILAIDLNGDGKVNDGSEIVFTQHAPGAATDLAALEQLYDTNHDGKLTAADHDFAKFGVWQDANGNGVADPGEFKSLAALGIVEIGLESDHQQSVSADGSVVTYGETTFTTADGETGAVADIGFGNYDGVATGTSTLVGTSGADTFKIDNLNIKDLITDFHGAEGDKIDLTALFDKTPAGNIADYVHYDSATSTVSVDTSGSGNPVNFVDVAVLQNAPAAGTINILYDDTNHQQHTATV